MQNTFYEYIDNANTSLVHTTDKATIKIITCGSVDDGKSTLIGRLLYDSNNIPIDHLDKIKKDTKKYGVNNQNIEYSLFVDGLQAEREQGITIDVAYRYFRIRDRTIILADTPGHQQYTRNMATAASNADIAIVLVDAQKGIAAQTKRHTYIASLFKIKKIILAVNKIDLDNYSEIIFNDIVMQYFDFIKNLNFQSVQAIPISALHGDNVGTPSDKTPWYNGPCLMDYLELSNVPNSDAEHAFRFPVQSVIRTDQGFRGFAGTISSGVINVGDTITEVQSGISCQINGIVTYDGELSTAKAGQAVTLLLSEKIDVSRGSILADPNSLPNLGTDLTANILWFGEERCIEGNQYIFKSENTENTIILNRIIYRVNINNLEREKTNYLAINEVGECHLQSADSIVFDKFEVNTRGGCFILIDRLTNHTVGAGMIVKMNNDVKNSVGFCFNITKKERALQKNQRPSVIWLTGLSGSGKSTIANNLEKELYSKNKHSYIIDGDVIRNGICSDLGYDEIDRSKNIRRIGQIASLMIDAGLIVIVACISPLRDDRHTVRSMFQCNEFVEVFIDTTLEECIARDPKGLYAKALAGKIDNFTGLNAPYESPLNPEIHIKTNGRDVSDVVEQIIDYLL